MTINASSTISSEPIKGSITQPNEGSEHWVFLSFFGDVGAMRKP
jgi:hypothetical protein